MYLDPERMDAEFRLRIVRWLEANGCRHHIAMEPLVVRGKVVEYVALCRKDQRSILRAPIRDYAFVPLGRKRLRLRIPLSEVA